MAYIEPPLPPIDVTVRMYRDDLLALHDAIKDGRGFRVIILEPATGLVLAESP